jgi:transposase InsO family protein
MKKDILTLISTSTNDGLTEKKVCSLLQISERRVQRWRKRQDQLKDIPPGPVNAPHALLESEKDAIYTIACDEQYMDESHRTLAAKGSDEDLFHASASSVYRVLQERKMTTDRVDRARCNGKSIKPDRPEIDGPNQRWCWDISYCHTETKGLFLYLFALLDEYSRKVISWRISWNMTHIEGIELIQEGLENEGLVDIDVKLPDLMNDRGAQMKAKAFMKMCKDIGINQQFSRPRTPNDNPFIESLFSTVKGYPSYPGVFTDDIEAVVYFTAFFNFYNNERYHTRIGMVTPNQRHTGEDKGILERRRNYLQKARSKRLFQNKLPKTRKILASTTVIV